MRDLKLAALFGGIVAIGMSAGCGGETVEAEERPLAKQLNLRELLDNKGESDLVATIRGPGQVGYLQPVTRRPRGTNDAVTTFRIQNTSTGALAGFKVDEFWYDRAGDTVTGGSFRMQQPFIPGQIVEVEIRIPRDRRMNRSNYEFSHKNGVIEATLFEEMDEPTPVEEEEAEQG
jgi:hypothetical protein